MQNNKPQQVRLPLMSLWEKTDRNGNKYFSGSLNGLPVTIFPAKKRAGDKSPTHYMFVSEKFKKEEDQQTESFGPEPETAATDIPF